MDVKKETHFLAPRFKNKPLSKKLNARFNLTISKGISNLKNKP